MVLGGCHDLTEQKQEQDGKLSIPQRLKVALTGRHPATSLQESKRWVRMGLLQYPQTHDRHLRLFYLMKVLEDIEDDLENMENMTDAQQGKRIALHIKKQYRAFMAVGSPWIRGLSNRELAKKQNMFFKLLMICGHLPSFYPDIKYCGDIILSYTWQAIDVTPQTPVLFETKAMMKEETERVRLGSEVETY